MESADDIEMLSKGLVMAILAVLIVPALAIAASVAWHIISNG